MRLVIAQLGAVEARLSAASRFHRVAEGSQLLQQAGLRCVDGGGIVQAGRLLLLNPSQGSRLLCQKLLQRQVALLLVAFPAGPDKVGDAVGAAPRPGDEVLDLFALLPAVGALVIPFLPQVGANFSSKQSAALVLLPLDVGVQHLLHVEANQLHREGIQRRPPVQPLCPGNDGQDAVHQ